MTPGKLLRQWDYTFGIGGPIKKDRLWWQATYRRQGVDKTVVDSFYDKNPGTDVSVTQMIRKTTDKSRGIRLGNYLQIRAVEDEELEQVWAGNTSALTALANDRSVAEIAAPTFSPVAIRARASGSACSTAR